MLTRIAQLIIVLIPITLFGRLLYLDIAPGGEFVVRYEVSDTSPFIDNLLPDERVIKSLYNSSGESYSTIINDPVYFAVHTPETQFESVEVEVEFQNSEHPIIEFGPRASIFSEAYDLRPLHNLLLENLGWGKLEDGDRTLYQREETFDSVSDFFNDLPDRSSIATYKYDLSDPYRISSYTPLGAWQTFDVSLRGYHKYVTYIKDEPFVLKAVFMDMNRNIGEDEVVVRVWNERDEVMLEEVVSDDGNTVTNQTSSTSEISMSKDGWPEGVYTVELSGTSDIFWREFSTTQRYMTFVNQLYIGDDVGYLEAPRPSVFYTNAKHLTLETFHADATQLVTFGTDTAEIENSHENIYHTVLDPGIVVGSTPAGDVKIVGDGKFSFSRGAYFDPDPASINTLTDLEALDIDYIITSYVLPKQIGNWLVGSDEFSLDGIVAEDGAITFTLSTPYISFLQNTVDVHAINLTFKKEPLTRSGFWKALRERLPFGL
ncbi:MAG: hypothetical protein Q8P30_03490 [Candidatus Uhrbacteria bacterium]|nr:hypothetical protein [Candidatus Uhrbacteria bacterium]